MKQILVRSLFFSVLTVVAVAGGSVSAAEGETNAPVSVDALIGDVLAHNPELAFYQAEISAAKSESATAALRTNPELTTQLGHKRVSGGGLASEGVAWSLGLQQTFEWPGRMALRKAIANHQVKLAELGLAQFRAMLAGKTRVAAANLYAAQERAAVVRTVAERLRDLKEVLIQRDPAGLTPLLETRIIEATEITLQKRVEEAELAEQTARLDLNQLRGSPWQDGIRIAPMDFTLPPLPNGDSLLFAARTNSFELRTRQVELEQQGFRIELAKNERYPAVSVGPFVSGEYAGDQEHIVGLAVSVPLPMWNNGKGKIATEESRRVQAQTSLHVAQRQLEKEVVEHMQTYQSKLAALAKWRPDAIAHFGEAAELADRHYRLGAVPVGTYVELQKQYLEAVEALLDTKREALEAQQQLRVLTGLDFKAVQTAQPGEAK